MRRIIHLFALATAVTVANCGTTTEPGPGKPTTLVISAGDGQSGSVGARLNAPIAVRVTDDQGRGVPGQVIDFFVTSGGGELLTPSATTNSNGVATNRWTLGTNIAEQQRVTAQLLDPTSGAVLATVVFRATPTAGPPNVIFEFSGNGQFGPAGQRLPEPLTVIVFDGFQNPVPNVTVTFAVTTGGGSISPTSATTSASGRASASWTLGADGAQQTATATVAGLGSVTFFATALRPREGTSVALGGRPFGVAVSANDVVYVTQLDANSVSRFNGTSTTVAATIPVGSIPTDVQFDPSGTRAYVANQYSNNVGIINAATNAVEGTIGVTGNPFKVLVSPDAARLYVLTNANAVYAIDLATKAVVGQLSFPATPNGLAITRDGARLYVGTRAGGTVVEIDTRTMTALRTFFPGGTVQEVQLALDGSELYTVNEQGSLFIYDLSTGALASTINLGSGSGAFGAALTPAPDLTHLFVTLMWTGEVKVVDRTSRTVTRTFFVDGTPRRIAFTSNGTAVVANEAGYVTWIK